MRMPSLQAPTDIVTYKIMPDVEQDEKSLEEESDQQALTGEDSWLTDKTFSVAIGKRR